MGELGGGETDTSRPEGWDLRGQEGRAWGAQRAVGGGAALPCAAPVFPEGDTTLSAPGQAHL